MHAPIEEQDIYDNLLVELQLFENPLAAGTAIARLVGWWLTGWEGDASDRALMRDVFARSLETAITEADEAARRTPRLRWLSGGGWPQPVRSFP